MSPLTHSALAPQPLLSWTLLFFLLFFQDDMAARLRSVLSLAGIPQEGFPVKVRGIIMTARLYSIYEDTPRGR